MGMDLNVYTKGLTRDLLPLIKKRFADFSMDIEFHPDFQLDEETDSGFCPIKLKMHQGQSNLYDNFGQDVLTGFELIFDNYDYEGQLKEIREDDPQEYFVANQEIDEMLKQCNKELIVNWHSENKSELRVSLFFCAVLAELTNGVLYDPQRGRNLTGQQALVDFPSEIEEYERSFKQEHFTLFKFEEWM
jgi:hypothetical protein